MQCILVLIINISSINYFEGNWNTCNMYVMTFKFVKKAWVCFFMHILNLRRNILAKAKTQ